MERNYDSHSRSYLIEQIESLRSRVAEQYETIELYKAMKDGFTVRATDYEKRIAELESEIGEWFVTDAYSGMRLRGPYTRGTTADAVRQEMELNANNERNRKWNLTVTRSAVVEAKSCDLKLSASVPYMPTGWNQ